MLPMPPAPPFSLDHVHPILVNFTAALVPASLGSDLLSRIIKRESLAQAAWWMLLYAALVTPLTVIAGLVWKYSMDEAGTRVMFFHQWLGVALGFAFVALAVWRGSFQKSRRSPNLFICLRRRFSRCF